jgi:hypothetical protein
MSEPTDLPPHANEVLSHISDALTEIAIALNAMSKSIIEILALAKIGAAKQESEQQPPAP